MEGEGGMLEKIDSQYGYVRKVFSCFVIGMLLMSVFPVSVFAFKPIPTRIHLQDATFEWHTNQSLIAKLVDENGQPLSGKKNYILCKYISWLAGIRI